MKAGKLICAAACASIFHLACAARHYPLSKLAFPYMYKGDINKARLEEPSGIVYHPARKTLFAVGDEGDVCEMTTDGKLIKTRNLSDGGKEDLEGITVHTGTGLLYVAVEGKDMILEIDPETLDVTREFPIDRIFKGRILIAAGGQGIEGIAFVPGADGNTFYISNQSFDLENEDDPSIIMKVRLPLSTAVEGSSDAIIVDYFSPGIIDISDIYYDSRFNTIVAISDAENVIFEMKRDGTLLLARPMPGKDQEGIAVDPDGNLYIAQDSGQIIKYTPK
ncbi:MAG: SdiA-regulated domain-containing protein [Candidatus Tritonobacter lacicola]|nr:SdiA-regulated domain-containing protein [Candidatus Tritonobacter lacicola]